ncbi:ABC transporter ATP-binding protein [Streptomyces sp. NBC_00124]|uniref:ABC transporter ATP-binding protein n=1 Tax=Streptomyces sp. NBC_00124 TaxID=2975662 RepID=UPI00225BE539|nr:ABC transporter ATP-binding protein [Streptomyces sp. NBC_00124]MCX5357462.1 ABC transporter ATP-binding protein [Streptomyces sp. NBC_00124]
MATAVQTALSFAAVDKRFDSGTTALSGVDLRVETGEFVAVVGPSGCGKSTLLRLASGLDVPSAGEIDMPGGDVGYVFQDATLLPWRSVLANVALPAELAGRPKSERHEDAMDAIRLVGLDGFEKQLPGQLSGGMRMRVSLARALMMRPALFLFDEPFGALDEMTRLRMQEELQRIFAETGFAGLFITHSVTEAVFLANRVVVMSARPGRITAEFEVPFAHPRPASLRYEPEFAAIAGAVSEALRGDAQ